MAPSSSTATTNPRTASFATKQPGGAGLHTEAGHAECRRQHSAEADHRKSEVVRKAQHSAGSDTRGRDARSDERERTHSDGSTSRSRDSLCENQTSCDSSDRKMCAGTCSKAEEMTALLLGPR
jgi:hypothetical protein